MTKDKLMPRPIEAPQPCGNGQRGAHQERRNAIIAAGAIRYSIRQGLAVVSRDWSTIRIDPSKGKRIAAAYLAAPAFDPDALPAYRAMRDETLRQLDYLTNKLGVHVEATPDDPYANAIAMMAELREGRLRVYATGAGDNSHSFFSDDENDAFRAVHDAFGHAATGRGFDRHGEEAAWRKHSQMYSPLARRAMTTETRGQSCTFIYAFGGRIFPPQKTALLPPEFWHD
jgi:hypothetical protein